MELLYYCTRAPVKSKLRALPSHPVTRAGPSALEGFTSVFGMGTGVTPHDVPSPALLTAPVARCTFVMYMPLEASDAPDTDLSDG